jgi:hypothetical protein
MGHHRGSCSIHALYLPVVDTDRYHIALWKPLYVSAVLRRGLNGFEISRTIGRQSFGRPDFRVYNGKDEEVRRDEIHDGCCREWR